MDIAGLNCVLKNKHVYRKLYPGATPQDLQHYCTRTLDMDKPDIVIINVGTNSIGTDDPFTIAREIIKIVKICHERGCNKVFVSAITHRPNYPDVVEQLNNVLRAWQLNHDYEIIYNDNIKTNCLSYDNLHLNKRGKERLCANFRRALNKNEI